MVTLGTAGSTFSRLFSLFSDKLLEHFHSDAIEFRLGASHQVGVPHETRSYGLRRGNRPSRDAYSSARAHYRYRPSHSCWRSELHRWRLKDPVRRTSIGPVRNLLLAIYSPCHLFPVRNIRSRSPAITTIQPHFSSSCSMQMDQVLAVSFN